VCTCTSDIDVPAVTERPVADAGFAALAVLHAPLAASPNPYANRMELAYIDRAALKRFEADRRHPTLGQGEALAWTKPRAVAWAITTLPEPWGATVAGVAHRHDIRPHHRAGGHALRAVGRYGWCGRG
jgi:hypothetical protein